MVGMTARWVAPAGSVLRWWFPEVPVERIAVFRIIVTAFALIDVLVAVYVLRYARVDPVFFDPVLLLELPWLLGLHAAPVPPPGFFVALYVVMVLSLASSLLGYRTRLALMLAGPLYLYHWAVFNSWGKINHGKIPVIFALFVLLVAPSAARYSMDAVRAARRGVRRWSPGATDPLAGWALRVVGVVIVGSYLLSVFAKLDNSGLEWALQPVLASVMQVEDGALAQYLVRQAGLLIALQMLTIVLEALAVLAFFGGLRRDLVLAGLAGMHLGSYVILQTEFFGFIACYACFYRLERIADHVPPAWRGWFGLGRFEEPLQPRGTGTVGERPGQDA